VTGLIDHEELFDRVARLLAAGEFLLVLWIGWAVDRPLSAIMPNRGPRRDLRPFGREPHGSIVGRAGWQELLVGSCLMQHGMEELNPFIGVRLGHPKELSLHFLDGLLFYIRQHKEECVGYRGSGTRVIRTVAADCARLPINGMGLHVGHKGLLNMRQKRLEFVCGSSGHRPYTPDMGSDILIAWYRHLRHSVSGREGGHTLNLDKVYLKEPLKSDYLWASLWMLGAVYFMFRSQLHGT
jgi:hypothetical protein